MDWTSFWLGVVSTILFSAAFTVVLGLIFGRDTSEEWKGNSLSRRED